MGSWWTIAFTRCTASTRQGQRATSSSPAPTPPPRARTVTLALIPAQSVVLTSSSTTVSRVWIRLEEGLHCLPEGLHEEDCEVFGGQQPSSRGGHFQEEHQRLHEGCVRAVQGPAILCW